MTRDREYATEVLSTVISGNAHHLAERLLAALAREEKLREIGELLFAASYYDEYVNDTVRDAWRALSPAPEPQGNFSDTQDTNPEGGC